MFAATVAAMGILPIEGLALIFGVYRFLSIAIAACNVVGNTVATLIVAKLAGEFDEATAESNVSGNCLQAN